MIYNVFISQQIFSEGAIRCLPLWRGEALSLHPWNHALYPVSVYLWNNLSALFNLAPANAVDFIINSARMNALCASLSLVLFFEILRTFTGKETISFIGTVALGFSGAFIYNATWANEPMAGFLFSMAALLLVIKAADKAKAMPYLALSAFSLALSALFYLSMVSILPGILGAIALLFEADRRKRLKFSLAYSFLVALFIVLIVSLIALSSIDISELFKASYKIVAGPHIFFALKKMLKLPFGLAVSAIYWVSGWREAYYQIFSEGATGRPLIKAGILVAMVTAFCALIISIYYRLWSEMASRSRKIFYLALLTLFATFVPVIIHDPTYDKLWLQPTAFLIIISCFGLGLYRGAGFKKRLANTTACIFVGSFILFNTNDLLFANHFGGTRYLKELKELDEMLKDEDLVIGSWDNLSVLLQSLFDRDVFIMEDEMKISSLDRGLFFRRLSERIDDARRNKGKIYFLGVLEQPKRRWDVFLYERLKLPYDSFEEYRKSSQLIKYFRFPGERDMALYEYSP